MKPVPSVALAFLATVCVGPAAALDDTSLAPAWTSASQAERDAWLASFKFENAGVDRARVAQCLDKMAKWEALATNKLTSITSMCETSVKRARIDRAYSAACILSRPVFFLRAVITGVCSLASSTGASCRLLDFRSPR